MWLLLFPLRSASEKHLWAESKGRAISQVSDVSKIDWVFCFLWSAMGRQVPWYQRHTSSLEPVKLYGHHRNGDQTLAQVVGLIDRRSWLFSWTALLLGVPPLKSTEPCWCRRRISPYISCTHLAVIVPAKTYFQKYIYFSTEKEAYTLSPPGKMGESLKRLGGGNWSITFFFVENYLIILFFEGAGEILNFAFQWFFWVFGVIINPSVHAHTQTHTQVFSVLCKAQFKAAFRSKRQNKCYCYSQYTDVYSYLLFPLSLFVSTTVFSVTS